MAAPVQHCKMSADSMEKYEVLEKIGMVTTAYNSHAYDLSLITHPLQAMAPLESSARSAEKRMA